MPEELYGAPYLCMHRAELHAALYSAVAAERVQSARSSSAWIRTAGGCTVSVSPTVRTSTADAVIGADGVHSLVREIILGPDTPIHKGASPIARVSVQPNERDRDVIGPSRTKWWGTDRHIVIYYTAAERERALLRHQRPRAG